MTTISNKVRRYRHDMVGAPVLSAAAGALISVLDACLVTGFGNKAIDSLVVSGGIATANISSGHDFAEGDVLRISGATPAGLNSDWRLASVTATSVTWSVEGCGIADGTATGTITCLRAPAGWEKVFSDGTTRAGYRSLNHAGHNGLFLYVDDSTTLAAAVYGYENMTDIDTGVGRFPDTVLSPENWWGKSSVDDTSGREWTVVADDKRLTFCPRFNPDFPKGRAFSFGLLLYAQGADPWATFINGSATKNPSVAHNVSSPLYGDLAISAGSSTTSAGVLARGFGGGAPCKALSAAATSRSAVSGDSNFLNNDGFLRPPAPSLIALFESTGYVMRGYFPAVCFSTNQYTPGSTPRGTTVGVTGNGYQLEYGSTGSSGAWFISLGVNGKWD